MDSPPVERRLPNTDLDAEAYEEESERSPIGIAFLLGVVVGATASALFRAVEREEEEAPSRARRIFRRKAVPQEPRPLSEIVRSEATHVAESVVRDLGSAATRWILDLTSPPPAPLEPSDPEAESEPVQTTERDVNE